MISAPCLPISLASQVTSLPLSHTPPMFSYSIAIMLDTEGSEVHLSPNEPIKATVNPLPLQYHACCFLMKPVCFHHCPS